MTDANDTISDKQAPPTRGLEHEALAVFLGDWTAEGTAFGGVGQDEDDPKANGAPWTSEHRGYWHTGEFFLVQDEKARPGGDVFDTLSVMGLDPETGDYFARSFENHGFFRHYRVIREGKTWRFEGETERASITFSDDDRTQTIAWEWKPAGDWLPLCDRIATRID